MIDDAITSNYVQLQLKSRISEYLWNICGNEIVLVSQCPSAIISHYSINARPSTFHNLNTHSLTSLRVTFSTSDHMHFIFAHCKKMCGHSNGFVEVIFTRIMYQVNIYNLILSLTVSPSWSRGEYYTDNGVLWIAEIIKLHLLSLNQVRRIIMWIESKGRNYSDISDDLTKTNNLYWIMHFRFIWRSARFGLIYYFYSLLYLYIKRIYFCFKQKYILLIYKYSEL